MARAGAEGERAHDLDRELSELLQELRVILPGIQVLFAFLLIVPFSDRFHGAGSTTETAYFVAFTATTLASIFTIAPGIQHRLRWRQHDKDRLLRTANRLTLIATVLIAIAISAVAFLITDYLYGPASGAVLAAVAALLATGLWWGLPLVREHRRNR